MNTRTIIAIFFVAAATAVSAQTTRPTATTKPARGGTNAPAPDQLLNSMLRPATDSGTVLQPVPDGQKFDASAQRAVAPNAPTARLRREGSTIFDAVCRLTKSADGQQWELTLESDGKTMQDPPLIILPNLNLAAMESAVSGASRDLRFRVTGVVTEYKGRNYILLEKVVVPPDPTQQF
jgi:hypothetical protein